MKRSLRAMIAMVVGSSALLAIGVAQRPSCAQEATQAKTGGAPDAAESPARSKDRRALRDELDEIRVREEVLKWQRDADRNHLQQQVQTSRMIRSSRGTIGGFGEGGERHSEEQRKQAQVLQDQQRDGVAEQAERSLKEAEAEYLKTTKELARISRRRTELERRVGEVTPGKPKTDGALDQIQKVAGIVSQVQDEVANFGRARREGQPNGEPARRPLAGTAFIRVGDHIINPDQIVRIAFSGEHAHVYFTGGGDPLVLDKKVFERLERHLRIRGG